MAISEKQTIYLVEDEREILDFVSKYLLRDGFLVKTFSRGDVAMDAITATPPDLLILDIMLPGLDGIEILKRIRQESFIPVILLTSRTDEADRVIGLELGADDYVTKPFSPRELVARVKSLLRRIEAIRSMGQPDEKLRSKHLSLNMTRRSLEIQGVDSELTSIEFAILRHMMGRPGRVYPREELLTAIWGDEFTGETRTVDVHVKNLRKKIREAGGPADAIRSVWGVGYTFED